MTRDTCNVLFLCTANSARSILAEAILSREGKGRFRAFSAGSRPASAPHPMALALLEAQGHDTGLARSKGWDDFAAPGAPRIDVVITVCDDAAGEECPLWPGHPLTAHWGLPDPARAGNTEAERRIAFEQTYRHLLQRIRDLVTLEPDTMDRATLKRNLDRIGGARSGPAQS